MDFYQIITLLFSFLGLMNGLFAAGLFRLKRFYLYGIAGALISCGAVQYYVWYALAYPEYGWAAHFGAYFACALMAADIMLVLPLFLLMMIGTVRFIRRYAQIFGVAVMALSLFIGVYGSVDGEMKEEAERYTIAAEELPEERIHAQAFADDLGRVDRDDGLLHGFDDVGVAGDEFAAALAHRRGIDLELRLGSGRGLGGGLFLRAADREQRDRKERGQGTG